MCLIVLAWKVRDDLPLAVAANRDEWRERPTQPAHWWPDHPQLLAGRDLIAGGTWMGVTRAGRFAAVTNFRDPSDRRTTAVSRGGLVSGFLLGKDSPGGYLAAVSSRAREYNGFNLIVGDGETLWYYGSRAGNAHEITPGVHALSNHLLDEPWPKVVRARAAMAASLVEANPVPRLFTALADTGVVADASLPSTGVGIEWERRLSAALITGADYGTRSSTVMTVDAHGEIGFEEHTLDADGHVIENRVERLQVQPA